MWLVASEAPSGAQTTVPYAGLVSYGALGIMFVLGVLGYVYFKPSVTDLKQQNSDLRADFDRQIKDQKDAFDKQVIELRRDYTDQLANLRKDHTEQIVTMRQERDKANVQRDAMADTFQKEWIPALVKSLATVEALIPLMQRLAGRPGGDQQ